MCLDTISRTYSVSRRKIRLADNATFPLGSETGLGRAGVSRSLAATQVPG